MTLDLVFALARHCAVEFGRFAGTLMSLGLCVFAMAACMPGAS